MLEHSGVIYGGQTKLYILFSEDFIPIDGMIYFNANIHKIEFYNFKIE